MAKILLSPKSPFKTGMSGRTGMSGFKLESPAEAEPYLNPCFLTLSLDLALSIFNPWLPRWLVKVPKSKSVVPSKGGFCFFFHFHRSFR